MSTATIQNKNGYVFHTSKNYNSEHLAVHAAIRGAKKKKIIVDEINFFVCIDGVCNGDSPSGRVSVADYIS